MLTAHDSQPYLYLSLEGNRQGWALTDAQELVKLLNSRLLSPSWHLNFFCQHISVTIFILRALSLCISVFDQHYHITAHFEVLESSWHHLHCRCIKKRLLLVLLNCLTFCSICAIAIVSAWQNLWLSVPVRLCSKCVFCYSGLFAALRELPETNL